MIEYREGNDLDPAAVAQLYRAAELRRPVDDLARIGEMLAHANLVVSGWDGDRLVGVARSLSDFSYVTYLADLAVHPAYQGRGIGRELIERTAARGGDRAALLLRASPPPTATTPAPASPRSPAATSANANGSAARRVLGTQLWTGRDAVMLESRRPSASLLSTQHPALGTRRGATRADEQPQGDAARRRDRRAAPSSAASATSARADRLPQPRHAQ